MKINDVFIEVIKDIDKRKMVVNNLTSVIRNINNISYYYTVKGKKRKNPNIDIKNDYNVLLNSGIVILYSHWEGFIKYSGKKYLEFLSQQEYKREKLDKCFVDYYINNKKNDLSNVLQNIVDDSPIPIDIDMLKDIQNLDYKNLKKLFNRIGFDYGNFLSLFQKNIESITGLNKGSDFLFKISNFKKSDHFFVEYLAQNKISLNGDKILQKIIYNNNNQDISLISLRHKIAHGVDINISYERFISLSNITLLLLDIYLIFFKQELIKKYR